MVNSNNPAVKQSIILHDGPSSPPYSTMRSFFQANFGSVYITDDTEAGGGNPYDSFPTDWTSFLDLADTMDHITNWN